MAGRNAANQGAKAQRMVNMQRALELRTAGLSVPQIAAELGVSEFTAYRYVRNALENVAKQTDDDAIRLRALELERLDKLQRAAERVLAKNHVFVNAGRVVYDGAEKLIDDGPVLAAIDRLVRIAERRAKLLGLDAPARVEQSGDMTITVHYADDEAAPR